MRISSERPVFSRLSPRRMTSRLIATCALGLAGMTAVSAADVPLAARAAPPATAPASWAGFYLGIHGGYGWGKNDFFQTVIPGVFGLDGFNSSGAVYGGQTGYNWQYGRAVTGVEIDFSAADIKGGSSLSGFFPGVGAISTSRSDRAKYLGTARARLGWLPADTVLLYGTAGAAWGRVDQSDTTAVVNPPNSLSIAETRPFDRSGWVAGAGVEAQLFGSNWIGRLEYLHYDFGSVQRTQSTVSSIPNASYSDRAGRQTFDVVRAGLSYRFGSPADRIGVPYAKAPQIAAATTWAGFYLGAHGGYGWGENNFSQLVSLTPPVHVGGVKLRGGVYGGQAGYNWQFDRAVAGLELDFGGTGIGGSAQTSVTLPPATSNISFTDKVAYLGSVRARLGWLPLDNVLLYGTAGLGWERLDRTTDSSTTSPAGSTGTVNNTSSDRLGWVAGAGVETMLFGTNWIGRLEYLHYGFGTVQTAETAASPNGSFVNSAGNHSLDIVRAGLSYKFGEPAAVAPLRHAKAPALAPSSTWAGFYLGAHGGYGWKDNDFTQAIVFATREQTGGIGSKGWVAGGHAGYNWQYARVVAGFEADFSFSDLKGSSAPVSENLGGGTLLTTTLGDEVKYLATARTRLGWLPTETVLLYATGGLAWERLERTKTRVQTAAGFSETDLSRTPSDHFGGVVGAGAEWMPWGPNWIGRVEYLHYDFGKFQGTTTFSSTVPGNVPFSEHRGRQTIEVLRAGISYKFGG